MKISTALFGDIEIDENKVINFETGLPGFADETQFIILHDEENPDSPFCFLQSMNDTDIVFTLVDILRIKPNYAPAIHEEDLLSIGKYEESDFFVYCIATVSDNIEELTANLKAPVLINVATRQGRQGVASNEEYEIKHKIFDEIKNRE